MSTQHIPTRTNKIKSRLTLELVSTHPNTNKQVETFPDKHESVEDFLETLKYAFLYAKTVTLGPTHWPKTNSVMLRNRRIGCSMSGLAQVCAASPLVGGGVFYARICIYDTNLTSRI